MLSPTTLRFAIDKRAGSSISKPKIGAYRYQRQNGTGKPEAENVANVMSGDALSGINCGYRFRSLIFVHYHCRSPLLNAGSSN
jgi:hypothetical protein